MADTLYERLGGKPAIRMAVDEFYRRMTADPVFADRFSGVDMDRLRRHQAAVLTLLTGGPNETPWQDVPAIHEALRRTHGEMRLTDGEFDQMAGHLAASLRHLGVPDEDIQILAAALEDFRLDIVTAVA